MEQEWFNIISEVSETSPEWVKEAIQDKDYIVIKKDEYCITRDLLEKKILNQHESIQAIEFLSIVNANEFGKQLREREEKIKHLEIKIKRIKDNNVKSHEILEQLQDKYNDLKERCDTIFKIISNLQLNIDEII